MSKPLLILGASARAAAWSARCAGFQPMAGDVFADEDLRACCPAWRCERYPHDLERIAAEAPPGPWMYTGGLENHPSLVDRIAARRPLWGNPGDVLREARDPFRLAEVLAAAGIATPEVVANPRGLPCDGSWLKKPRSGSGGWNVQRITEPCDPAKSDSSVFFQQFIAGVPQSGVFIAADGKATLLGVTEQLIGDVHSSDAATFDREFRYAGSIGPLALTDAQLTPWRAIGDALAATFGLVGLFGVDAVVADDRVWPIEINPRYTASIEIIERGTGVQSIGLHAQACAGGGLIPIAVAPAPKIHGKAIVYARKATRIAEPFARYVEQINTDRQWPQIADIPSVGATIPPRSPIASVFAEGGDASEVRQRLRDQARKIEAMLDPLTTVH